MTRFWLETAIAAVEIALILRIVWLIRRSKRWDRRWATWNEVRNLEAKTDYLWYLYRDTETRTAKRLYEQQNHLEPGQAEFVSVIQ